MSQLLVSEKAILVRLVIDVRAEEIKSLTNAYVETVGERPEPKQLERLADLLLYEVARYGSDESTKQ